MPNSPSSHWYGSVDDPGREVSRAAGFMEMSKCFILKTSVDLNVLHPQSLCPSVPFSEQRVLLKVLFDCHTAARRS